MPVPVNPIKFIVFSEIEHLIFFPESLEFEAVEYMQYEKSVNGKGREIIVTRNDKTQFIITDSKKAGRNLTLADREVLIGEINVEKAIDNGKIHMKVLCSTDDFSVKMMFKGLFPVSDYKAGIIDPKRHGDSGLPMIYTSQNTAGGEVILSINHQDVKVSKAKDRILEKLNAFDAYYSTKFYLSVLSLESRSIHLSETNSGVLTYMDEIGEKIFIRKKEETDFFESRYSNYVDEYYVRTFCSEDNGCLLIDKYEVFYGKERILIATFDPAFCLFAGMKAKNRSSSGTMQIIIGNGKGIFNCYYNIETSTDISTLEKAIIKTTYRIIYSNTDWEENKRIISCKTETEIDFEKDLVLTCVPANILIEKF